MRAAAGPVKPTSPSERLGKSDRTPPQFFHIIFPIKLQDFIQFWTDHQLES